MLKSIMLAEREFDKETFERVVKDLKRFLAFKLNDRKKITDSFIKMYLVDKGQEIKDEVRRLAKELKHPDFNIHSCFNVLEFFTIALTHRNYDKDKPEHWVDDLFSLGALTDKQKPSLLKSIHYLSENISTDIQAKIKGKDYIRGVNPVWTGIDHAVDLRAIFEKSYRSHMSLDDYKPKITSLTAVAMIEFAYNDGEEKYVSFQVEESDLICIIDYLGGVKKDLEKLKGFID